MTKVAIVILNWNGKHFLEKFLSSVVNNSQPAGYLIYVADNGSTDNSIEFLKQNFPSIKLILFDKNYGFTGGYNKALAEIDAEYFVLLNSDVEVTPDWIKPIIDLMDSNSQIAACQPKIKAYHDRGKFEYAGAAGGFIDKFGYPFCRGRILNKIETDNGQYDDVREIFWATGACMFVRAELYKKIGGLDDLFFAHMEEIDLCWRLKNAGYKIYVVPTVTVYHVGGGTLPNNNPRKLFYNYRNNLFLLYKNIDKRKLFSTIVFRMLLDGLSAFTYLATFRFTYFITVFKAHIKFYNTIKDLKIKRLEIEQFSKSIKHNEIYSQSLVFSFFIKKLHTFDKFKFDKF